MTTPNADDDEILSFLDTLPRLLRERGALLRAVASARHALASRDVDRATRLLCNGLDSDRGLYPVAAMGEALEAPPTAPQSEPSPPPVQVEIAGLAPLVVSLIQALERVVRPMLLFTPEGGVVPMTPGVASYVAELKAEAAAAREARLTAQVALEALHHDLCFVLADMTGRVVRHQDWRETLSALLRELAERRSLASQAGAEAEQAIQLLSRQRDEAERKLEAVLVDNRLLTSLRGEAETRALTAAQEAADWKRAMHALNAERTTLQAEIKAIVHALEQACHRTTTNELPWQTLVTMLVSQRNAARQALAQAAEPDAQRDVGEDYDHRLAAAQAAGWGPDEDGDWCLSVGEAVLLIEWQPYPLVDLSVYGPEREHTQVVRLTLEQQAGLAFLMGLDQSPVRARGPAPDGAP